MSSSVGEAVFGKPIRLPGERDQDVSIGEGCHAGGHGHRIEAQLPALRQGRVDGLDHADRLVD